VTKKEMANKTSRCNICGEFLNSKRELKGHKDKHHRITSSRVVGPMADTNNNNN
jgi:hypothetical protein